MILVAISLVIAMIFAFREERFSLKPEGCYTQMPLNETVVILLWVKLICSDVQKR